MEDKVSVIIPTFNRSARLKRTIQSVLAQDYDQVEIIVIDDGSTDSTEVEVKNMIEGNRSTKAIKYFYQVNSGACAARNRGMMIATGSLLMFLDSDDFIRPDKLSRQASLIRAEASQCAICDFLCLDAQGDVISYRSNNMPPLDFVRNFSSPHVSSLLIRRDSIPPGLCWNQALSRHQDMDFVFKYFSTITSYSYRPEPMFYYSLHGGERISDSYRRGAQYNVLLKSLRRFLRSNESFLTVDRKAIYSQYRAVLYKHFLRHAASVLFPRWLKACIKSGFHNGSSPRTKDLQ